MILGFCERVDQLLTSKYHRFVYIKRGGKVTFRQLHIKLSKQIKDSKGSFYVCVIRIS